MPPTTSQPSRATADVRMLERLRTALDFSAVGAWEWDLRTGEAWWSDHLYVVLGRTPDSIPTTLAAFLECLAEDDREPFRSSLRLVLQTCETRTFTCRVARPDGTLRLCRGQMGAVPDGLGRCRQVIGALRDITVDDPSHPMPDDLLLRALREQRAEFRALVDAAPYPLLLVDARQRIRQANRATEEVFGWRPAELLGRGLDTLFAEPGPVLDALLLVATATAPAERAARRVVVVGRAGHTAVAEMTVAASVHGEAPRFVVAFGPLAPPWGGLGSSPGLAERVDAPPARR